MFEVSRPVVCVQGLGFVGMAMAVAVANARDVNGNPKFNVIGVELPTPEGKRKVKLVNQGRLPIVSADDNLSAAMKRAFRQRNLLATTSAEAFNSASVVVVSINLDVQRRKVTDAYVDFTGFKAAIRTIGEQISPNCLVLVETTVPPGTCEIIVYPELASAFQERGLDPSGILLAHSYERVMPGKDYYNSIVNYWRVYAGHSKEAADRCEEFLSHVINVKDYPLVRLGNTTASEIAKVLENSYRAVNIAFIEEWSKFAEAVGVNLFEVVNAIRMRPTHSNIRQPGLGVGGYCLTKDPLLGMIAARDIFHFNDMNFVFSEMAVNINDRMPLHAVGLLKQMLTDLKGKRILLLGVSYRPDIGDTRFSPSEKLAKNLLSNGSVVVPHDPFVKYWDEMDMKVLTGTVPSFSGYDAVVFAVAHQIYRKLHLPSMIEGNAKVALLDANGVLTSEQYQSMEKLPNIVKVVGRGDK